MLLCNDAVKALHSIYTQSALNFTGSFAHNLEGPLLHQLQKKKFF